MQSASDEPITTPATPVESHVMTPKPARFLAYLRVSTARQGRSGLGLEAQRAAVQRLVADRGGKLIAPEYVEVESGRWDERPKLEAAFDRCRQTGATLVIAKLDRLSRDAHFLTGLHKAGIEFIAADMPFADRFTVTIMAAVAEKEALFASVRTKEALAAAKRRGVKLGGYRKNSPDIRKFAKRGAAANKGAALEWAEGWRKMLTPLVSAGLSCAAIAARLNDEGSVTRNGEVWAPAQVHRTVKRLGL